MRVNKLRVSKLQVNFKVTITEKYGVNDIVTDVIDKFQKEFECCGSDGFQDYIHSAFNNMTGNLPRSCCTTEARKSNNPLCFSSKPIALKEVYHTKVIGFV